MSDTVEYIVKITDQGSKTMQKIGMGADSAVSKVQRLQKESTSLSQKIGTGNRNIVSSATVQSIDKATGKVRNLGAEIQKTDAKGKSAGGGWFSRAISQIPFAGLLTNPFIIAGAAAGNALRLGIQQDLTNTSFKVLLNSEDAAQKMVADITQYGAETPYDKIGLSENAKTMLSFGLAEDSIMPNLRAIGDIAMGDANKMSSLTLAFSQMSSTGKLMGQDLLQMINAGFNPLNEISRKTGKSIGQLKKEMEEGKISSQMVTDAFRSASAEGGQFHGMAEAMGQTLGGKFAQLMDNLNEKFLILYKVIQPVVIKGVELADILVNKIVAGITAFVNKLREGNPVILAITGYIAALTVGLIAYKTYVTAVSVVTRTWAAVQALVNAVMYANPVGLIIAAIIALIALISLLIYKVDGWGKAWDYTVKAVKALWSGYMSYIKLGWLAAEDILLSGIDKIKIGWYSLKKLWDKDSANAAISQINAESEARKKAMAEEGKNIVNSTLQAFDYAKKAAGSFSINNKGFGDVKKELESKLGISAPQGVAGAAGTGSGNKDQTGKPGKGAKTNSSIATGGQRSNYITITLKDLIGVVNIQGKDFKDSAEQMTEQTADALLRLLAMANATAG